MWISAFVVAWCLAFVADSARADHDADPPADLGCHDGWTATGVNDGDSLPAVNESLRLECHSQLLRLDELGTRLGNANTTLDAIDGRLSNVNGKLDTLHDDLVAVESAITAQGSNPPTAAAGTDEDPQYVRLASGDGTHELVADAANVAHADVWFLAGLLAAGLAGYALSRAVLPR